MDIQFLRRKRVECEKRGVSRIILTMDGRKFTYSQSIKIGGLLLMNKIYFKSINKITYNIDMKTIMLMLAILSCIITNFSYVSADELYDVIQFYDEKMLLRDIADKNGGTGEYQKPILDSKDNQSVPTGMEVPRSIKYDTSMMNEAAELYREGRYYKAACVLQDALEKYRDASFEEGEIAVLGNLYLIYSKLGDEEEAAKYLEAYRKKRRKKSGSFMLITPDEANMQEAPTLSTPAVASLPGEPAGGTEQTMLVVPESAATGPEIMLISPEPESINLSPLKILVKFNPREGTKVDISTLRVELLKFITINITDRLKGYASNEGINVEKAELPSGNYKIRVTLSDTTGGMTSRVFVLRVQQ
jgi:hypothetical protein